MEESKWEEEGAPPRHRTWYMSLPLAIGDVYLNLMFRYVVVFGEGGAVHPKKCDGVTAYHVTRW